MNLTDFNIEIYENIINDDDLSIEDILNLKLVNKEFYELINQKKYYLRIINSLQNAFYEIKHLKNIYKSKVIRTQMIMYEDSYSEESDLSEIMSYDEINDENYII